MSKLYYFSLGEFQGYRNTTGSMQYLRSPELTYFTTENLYSDYQCPIAPSTQLLETALLLDGSEFDNSSIHIVSVLLCEAYLTWHNVL